MTNLTYHINIAWSPLITYPTNGTASGSFGAWKQNSYGGYYTAAMPEAGIFATGPDQSTALSNLLVIAGSASNPGMPPLSQAHYF